jgi:hypothetical protein
MGVLAGKVAHPATAAPAVALCQTAQAYRGPTTLVTVRFLQVFLVRAHRGITVVRPVYIPAAVGVLPGQQQILGAVLAASAGQLAVRTHLVTVAVAGLLGAMALTAMLQPLPTQAVVGVVAALAALVIALFNGGSKSWKTKLRVSKTAWLKMSLCVTMILRRRLAMTRSSM